MADSTFRIAYITDAIFPFNKGGKESRLKEISERVAATGITVDVYCMKWWQGADTIERNGVHFHSICPYIPLYDGDRRSIKQGLLFGLSCFRLLAADFDIADVDHMPFFPLYSMRIVCWIKQKKMIGTWHEVWGKAYWQKYVGSVKGTIASWVEQLSVFLPDEILAVSNMTEERLKKTLGCPKMIHVIPNGIDVQTISKVPAAKQHYSLIFAGRLLSHKNVDVLLNAIAMVKKKLPKISAVIIGDGPEREKLLKLQHQLDLKQSVTFLPFHEDIADVYGLMKSAELFVLPSSREGFGIVALEAFACGVRVLTVNEPDNAAKELINAQNGEVVDLQPNRMADKIIQMLSQKRVSKVTVDTTFDWQILIPKLINTYRTLIAKSG